MTVAAESSVFSQTDAAPLWSWDAVSMWVATASISVFAGAGPSIGLWMPYRIAARIDGYISLEWRCTGLRPFCNSLRAGEMGVEMDELRAIGFVLLVTGAESSQSLPTFSYGWTLCLVSMLASDLGRIVWKVPRASSARIRWRWSWHLHHLLLLL